MALSRLAKGKKRAAKEEEEESSPSPSLSPEPSQRPIVKKPKRAETRKCPVCEEQIPIRLLATHSELEAERVENIIKGIGTSKDVELDFQEGTRRSAARARKSMSTKSSRSNSSTDILEQTNKTILAIKRHRKQRHARFRDMAREEEDQRLMACHENDVVCPVCLQSVPGDEDVVQAHVDACLANEARLSDANPYQEAASSTYYLTGRDGGRIGNVSGMQGAGFNVRNHEQEDVDDEVDIDGDDAVVFGSIQFTESDILRMNPVAMEEEEGAEEGRASLCSGSIQGPGEDEVIDVVDTNEVDLCIITAKQRGDSTALISALERKIQQLNAAQSDVTTSQCRICLDPYTEPTVSTGCWHTCCRECWLRCLGSTKLCPICKRITSASDLRRIYL